MENVYSILSSAKYTDLKAIAEKHIEWAKANERFRGEPVWHDEPGTLNIIGVRCNTEADFNFGKYNDYLILVLNKENDEYTSAIINVTVDPATTKNGIAHLRQGAWNSYVVRPHRWARRRFGKFGEINRWACCQDLHTVEIVRTDGKGKIISTERGMYGINIHDNGGYRDSSLGCTVIQSDESYLNIFLPMIYNLSKSKPEPVNFKNLTYLLINHSQIEKYYGESIGRIERASAEGGVNNELITNAEKAGRII